MTSIPQRLAEKLKQCYDLEILPASGDFQAQRGIYLSPRLMIDGYLNLNPDLLVVDPEIHAMGWVFILEEDADHAELIDRHAGGMAHLRHLLLTRETEAESPAGQHTPWSVELVPVYHRSQRDAVHGALMKLCRESGLVHNVGLHLLELSGGRLLDGPVRDAFRWLLHACREHWGEKGDEISLPMRVELTNFKIHRRFAMDLKEGQTLHLVHGDNGSGKSSLVEAILLAAGQKPDNYPDDRKAMLDSIRNKHAGKRKAVEVKLTSGGTNYAWPPETDIPRPAMFCIDQVFMSRLTHESPSERARMFVEAFFPNESDNLSNYVQSQERVTGMLDMLDGRLAALLGMEHPDNPSWEEVVQGPYGDLDVNGPVTDSVVTTLLAPSPDTLENLAPLVPGLSIHLEKFRGKTADRETWRENLEQLDRLLAGLSSDKVTGWAQTLARAEEVLDRLKDWRRGAGHETRTYGQVLNEWLHYHALAEMGAAQRTLNRTLAAEDVWGRGEREHFQAAQTHDTEALESALAEWEERRDRAQDAVKRHTKTETTDHPEARNFDLTPKDIQTLNEAGALLDEPELGNRLSRALQGDRGKEIGNLGREDWAEPLLDRCKQHATSLNNLDVRDLEGLDGGMTNLRRAQLFIDCIKQCREMQAVSEKLQQVFFDELKTMAEPLNELLSLFAPYRWIYSPIELAYADEKLHVTDADDNGDALIRRNLAELNSLALALFLLRAPLLENKLRLLILDDPLQNMDEVKVRTMARGFARIGCLMPNGWRLLMFFHGKTDMESFKLETHASTYELRPPLREGGDSGEEGTEPVITTHVDRKEGPPPLDYFAFAEEVPLET
ncbi:MAG: ATP-binding protein [Acidobacteriota bacterium]|nr:ATP-binding protein [Acidobacteriota bacterium]